MKRIALLVLFFLLTTILQAGNGYIYLADNTKLFYASNNEVYSPDGRQLLYFQKGNIFFSGGEDDKQHIFFLTTSMNPASTKLEMVYEKDSRKPLYSFANNKFYAGKTESDDLRDKTELLHIEQSKKWLAFYATATDSLLAYYPVDSLPGSMAIITAYTLIKQYGLEDKINVTQPSAPAFQNTPYATIKPVLGNQTANEWMWDGKILRPRWNVDQRLMWTYDGQIIKPMYSTSVYDQYSWDGETFKPLWRTSRAQEWNWDGRLMKPIWDTDWANQYKIEDGVVKPWSNVHTEREWLLEGDIPIPLIILIVSGIARPY